MSSYLTPLLVALGGALGALTRHTRQRLLAAFSGKQLSLWHAPRQWSRLFLIGLAFFFTQHFPSPCSAFLVTGFLGGLSDLLLHDE